MGTAADIPDDGRPPHRDSVPDGTAAPTPAPYTTDRGASAT